MYINSFKCSLVTHWTTETEDNFSEGRALAGNKPCTGWASKTGGYIEIAANNTQTPQLKLTVYT